VLLQRDGWAINVKRVYRIYQELSVQNAPKTPKRRIKAKLREDRTEARQIVPTIVDTFSRFSPTVDPRFSYRGDDVVLALERIRKLLATPDDPRRPGIGVYLPRSR
jgi:putative transposase